MENNITINNVDVINRKLLKLKNSITTAELTKGQYKFINMYIDIIDEYVEKSLDILDVNYYKEALMILDEAY